MPIDVTLLVQRQIEASAWSPDDDRQNPHGLDLARCLVEPPVHQTYLDSFNDNAPIDLWLVLREMPGGHGGYEVVFSEAEGDFGLAVRGDDGQGVLIGMYGSFPETLTSM